MSTVKISQLPQLPSIAANTSNTLFVGVDIPTGITGKFTATTLAQQLYANNYLVVGDYHDVYPNAVASFTGTSNNYIQTVTENQSNTGTTDVVVQANISTDTSYFVDLGFTGSEFVPGAFNSLGTSTDKLDGYLYVQGKTPGLTGGNLVIGTATTDRLVKFIVGGVDRSNVVLTLNSTGPSINSGSRLTFGDGTSQYVAAAPANYTQSAFDAANTAAANTVISQGVNTTQNTNITAVNNYSASAYALANTNATNITYVNQYAVSSYNQANTNANNITFVNQYATSAYNTANNALANTTGTFAGDLTTTGNVTTQFVRSKVTTINDNAPVAQFAGSLNTLNPSNSGYIVHVVGREGVPSRIALDSSGAAAIPNYLTRFARGTNLSPAATQSNDIIGRYSAFGYGSTQFNSSSDARIDFNALENYTDAAHGSSVTIHATPIGSNVVNRIVSISSGNTSITSANTFISGNTTILGNLNTPGTITANTFVGNTSIITQTANTIQFYPQYTYPAQSDGLMWFDYILNRVVMDTEYPGDRPGVGRVLWERVYNGTGSTINSMTPVKFTGAQTANNIPYVQKAGSDTFTTSAGMVLNPITDGNYGVMYIEGTVVNANTIGFSSGDNLFLTSTPGVLSNVAPYSPTQAVIQIGKVIAGANATMGKLRVGTHSRPEFGKINGSVIYANNNISVTSNTLNINDNTTTVNVTGNLIVTNSVTANSFTVNDSGLFRYNIAAGNATVTQLTSKSTAVSCNGRTGQITTSNANLPKGTGVTFTVNNNFIVSADDVVIVNIASGATVNRYSLTVTNVTSGSFDITIGNFDNSGAGGAMSDTLVINFAVIRVN